MQSEVKEHAELYLLLGMITPLGWLERSPSYKEVRENITDRDLALYGFLGYPVLMTADIILYKATRVPVGADQVAAPRAVAARSSASSTATTGRSSPSRSPC